MAVLVALALRLADLGARQLGVPLAGFALLAGLVLGAAPAGFVGLKIGQAFGWSAGAAAADRTAELNTLKRDLAEARADATNQRAAAELARLASEANRAAHAAAERRNRDYAAELARRGPLGACGLSDVDVARMRDNAWPLRGRARPARAAPGG